METTQFRFKCSPRDAHNVAIITALDGYTKNPPFSSSFMLEQAGYCLDAPACVVTGAHEGWATNFSANSRSISPTWTERR